MSTSPPLTWLCPGCGRRVPQRVAACHCGRTRDAARSQDVPASAPSRAAAPQRRPASAWRGMPADVKALVFASSLVVIAGVGWAIFGRHQPDRMPALLGYIEATPPPTPPPPPKRPPFKLPWWR